MCQHAYVLVGAHAELPSYISGRLGESACCGPRDGGDGSHGPDAGLKLVALPLCITYHINTNRFSFSLRALATVVSSQCSSVSLFGQIASLDLARNLNANVVRCFPTTP